MAALVLTRVAPAAAQSSAPPAAQETPAASATPAPAASEGESVSVDLLIAIPDPASVVMPALAFTATPEIEAVYDCTTTMAVKPAVAGATVDPRIGSYPVKPVLYSGSGKMPNWYGIEVDRLTAMPGIFSYDRDKMVDLTGAPTPANH